jgi:hypothetical protein
MSVRAAAEFILALLVDRALIGWAGSEFER